MSQLATNVAERSPSSRLERVIGVGGLTCNSVNTIVGSGIFGLPGIAAAMLGPTAVLAYILCAVLIVLRLRARNVAMAGTPFARLVGRSFRWQRPRSSFGSSRHWP